MTRVLVCGGRDYNDAGRVYVVLAKLHDASNFQFRISTVIEGGARGADALARKWANEAGVPVETYEADWEAFGRMAGGMRNKAMLDEGRPDLVIAFPGGSGTRNMIRQARKAGVEVVEIAP